MQHLLEFACSKNEGSFLTVVYYSFCFLWCRSKSKNSDTLSGPYSSAEPFSESKTDPLSAANTVAIAHSKVTFGIDVLMTIGLY